MEMPSLKVILSGKSILFLGAGFSADATNIQGEKIKDVAGLIKELLSQIGEDSVEGYDLDTAAQEYLTVNSSGGEASLAKLIHGNFSSRTYTYEQKTIVCQPWYRIYTTNYDNIVENICAVEGKKYTEKSITDSISPPITGCTQIVHIYGSIKNLSPDEFRKTFLLTEAQRDNSPFLKSPWYRRFHDDVLSASSIFFVGFSVSDIDLRRLLDAMPAEVFRKVHFITWEGEKKPIITRMKRFGTVHQFSLSGFSEYLLEKRVGEPTIDYSEPPMMLREIPYKVQSRATIPAQAIESLMISGEVELDLVSQLDVIAQPGSYTIPRRKTTYSRVLANVRSDRPVLIHGDIGNGKSIFSQILGYYFKVNGYRVFQVKKEPESPSDIVSFLQSTEDKVLVILDDLLKFKNLASSILNIGSSNITLLCTVRSSAIDTNRNAVYQRINGLSYVEVDLNVTDRSELTDWIRYLDENGIFGEVSSLSPAEKVRYLEHRCGGQLRDVMLELYSKGSLHAKVEELLYQIASLDADSRRVIGLSALLTICNFQDLCSYANISELVGANSSFEEFRAAIAAAGLNGLLKLEQGDIVVRSPALAQFIITRTFGLNEIIRISKISLNYINDFLLSEESFFQLGKTLLKFSSYHYLVVTRSDGESLERFYDECRVLRFAQSDPLFWVQRSICCMKIPAFDLAQKFAENAYGVAKNLRAFDTYQIDNHYARLLLTRSLQEGVSISGVVETQASELLQGVIARKSDDLYHPLSVMRLFAKISEKWLNQTNSVQRNALIAAIDASLRSISRAGALAKRFRNIPELERSLKSARLKLVNTQSDA